MAFLSQRGGVKLLNEHACVAVDTRIREIQARLHLNIDGAYHADQDAPGVEHATIPARECKASSICGCACRYASFRNVPMDLQCRPEPCSEAEHTTAGRNELFRISSSNVLKDLGWDWMYLPRLGIARGPSRGYQLPACANARHLLHNRSQSFLSLAT